VYASQIRQQEKRTDHDIIFTNAIAALNGVTKAYSSSSTPRELNNGYRTYESATSSYKLYDGMPAIIVLPKRGFARKFSIAGLRVTSKQLQHAIWAQGLGDKTVHPFGSKMFPTQMELSMQLVGTVVGQSLYPMEEHMLASEHGLPVFKFVEQLSAQQLKAYASQPRSKLLRQLENLILKEEKDELDRLDAEANPERTRLYNMTAKEMKAELNQLGLISVGLKTDLRARLLAYHVPPENVA
jgi:hypothetical protein